MGDAPDSEAQVLKRRAGLRENRRIFEEDNKNYQTVTPARLEGQLVSENSLYFTGRDTENNVIDAGNLLILGDTFHKLSKRARADANPFDINDFMDPLKKKLGLELPTAEDDDEVTGGNVRKNGLLGDWESVGWLAVKRAKTIIGMECMNGMMAIEHKKRQIKKRAKQAPLGKEVRPIEISHEKVEDTKNETMDNVANIYKRLQAYEANEAPLDYAGVNYFEWIINPHDFAQTVENMFYTAFLVREGKLNIEFDNEGIPRLYDAIDEDGSSEEPPPEKTQEIVELDMDVWQQAIKMFKITQPMIPDRSDKKPKVPNGNAGWY